LLFSILHLAINLQQEGFTTFFMGDYPWFMKQHRDYRGPISNILFRS